MASTVPVFAGERFVGGLTALAAVPATVKVQGVVGPVDVAVSVPEVVASELAALSLELTLANSQTPPAMTSTAAIAPAISSRRRCALACCSRRTIWRCSFRFAASRRC